MANVYDRVRAELPGGGEMALEAMDEYQLLEVGRKVYECARGLMRNPTFRKMIQEEAARIREEEAADQKARPEPGQLHGAERAELQPVPDRPPGQEN